MLVDGHWTAGEHAVAWDGRDERGRRVTSGVYYYRLETADFAETKRVTVLK